jgi:hypothetical protein
MKRLLLAAVATAALAAPVMAFTTGQQGRVAVHERQTLTCWPQEDRNDRDPVVRTYINLILDPSNDFFATTLEVQHALRSGRRINRDDQYTLNQNGLESRHETADFWWTGTLNSNRAISMRAHLAKNTRGWVYQETVYKDGHVDTYVPEMNCSED